MSALNLRYVSLPNPESVRAVPHLSRFEQLEFERRPNRRRDAGWLAARWLVKQILLERGTFRRRIVPRDISTLSLDDQGRQIRPYVLVRGDLLPVSVSISHTVHGVLVALSRREGIRVGVDLTRIDRRVGLWDQWYTQSERQWIQKTGDTTQAAELWGIKQAYYKAINKGEPFRPRQIQVTCASPGEFACHAVGLQLMGRAHIAVRPCDQHIAALVVYADRRWIAESRRSLIPETDMVRLATGHRQRRILAHGLD